MIIEILQVIGWILFYLFLAYLTLWGLRLVGWFGDGISWLVILFRNKINDINCKKYQGTDYKSNACQREEFNIVRTSDRIRTAPITKYYCQTEHKGNGNQDRKEDFDILQKIFNVAPHLTSLMVRHIHIIRRLRKPCQPKVNDTLLL